jgi:hypothetical protein
MKKRLEVLIRPFANFGPVFLTAIASLFLLAYIWTVLGRISYPFELDWMEGGYRAQMQQVLDGQPLYARPSLDYAAAIYTPLYFYASALFSVVAGDGFLPLRLVSFLASLGCFAFIFLIVHRRTSSFLASFVASCLFAATFSLAGYAFDLTHVDSLYLFFSLAGIYAFDSPNMVTRSVVSPTLLFLSFFTKQIALTVALSLSLAALLTRKRFERILFPLIFGVLFVGSYALINEATTGWYKYYIFYLPVQRYLLKYQAILFWTSDLPPLSIALCFCYLAFVHIWSNSPTFHRIVRDILIFGGLLLTSYFVRMHDGSWIDNLMPVAAGAAIYFGIGLEASLRRLGRIPALKLLVIVAAVLQFITLSYWPPKSIPTLANRQQTEKLLQRISSIKGDVYLSAHPWYLRALGKPLHVHEAAVEDVLSEREPAPTKHFLEQEMATAVSRGRFEAFVVDFEKFPLRPPNFDKYYELVDSSLTDYYVYAWTAGWGNRKPTYLYMRRPTQQTDSVSTDKSRG